jgi:hypothetical protein
MIPERKIESASLQAFRDWLVSIRPSATALSLDARYIVQMTYVVRIIKSTTYIRKCRL